jgi:hypothetical protein
VGDCLCVGELLAEDFVLEWPHDLVRIRPHKVSWSSTAAPEGWSKWWRDELPPESGFARREANSDENAGRRREWPAS